MNTDKQIAIRHLATAIDALTRDHVWTARAETHDAMALLQRLQPKRYPTLEGVEAPVNCEVWSECDGFYADGWYWQLKEGPDSDPPILHGPFRTKDQAITDCILDGSWEWGETTIRTGPGADAPQQGERE